MKAGFTQRVKRAVKSIKTQVDFHPEIALVIGTGLKSILNDFQIEARIPYGEIDEFPVSTAPSHAGELVFGTLGNQKIVAQNGRFHPYEGWDSDDIVLPVYALRALGATHYIVTNAAGALNTDYKVTDAMLIIDHLNFQGTHPLAGPNPETLGHRFPDLSDAYHKPLQLAATSTAEKIGIDLRQGIYAAVHGPEFETSAERRFLRLAGGDAVGMSTVAEVIAANHCGLKVLGFSAITNAATGGEDQQPDTLEDVIDNANITAHKICTLIMAMIANNTFAQS